MGTVARFQGHGPCITLWSYGILRIASPVDESRIYDCREDCVVDRQHHLHAHLNRHRGMDLLLVLLAVSGCRDNLRAAS